MFTRQAFEIFSSAISAVQPQVLLPDHLFIKDGILFLEDHQYKMEDINKLLVIAAGKAAPAMAKAAENQTGQMISKGICVTKYGHSIPLHSFQTLEAAHPLPDENSIKAGKAVLQALKGLTADDIVVILLSGGASSLLADLVQGCTLEELQQVFELLINCGAGIHEINTVRKHLSRIKGGQLAKAAYPAKLFTFIISDVVGDDPGTIASGLTVPDDSTFEETYHILLKYDIWESVANSIREYISHGLNKKIEETPKPGSVFFSNSHSRIIGSNRLALAAAKRKAESLHYNTIILDETLTGDTEQEAHRFVNYLREYKSKLPACILMGGETTLKVTGSGKGGRNQHFVLSAVGELIKNDPASARNITILGAGTDGTDGPTDAAGAVFNNKLQGQNQADAGSVKDYLKRFDAYNYFKKNGGLVITGPTQTNVMDIVIGLLN